ncbi:hypothetical protein [Sphingomonas aerophila]|uniref:Uncharacterized protein n=1 Tax=Sphingomonas aerophila TaxID=1344948 RepID=A0A7W9BCT7_9SPHN|nr:hypothetical protein [Sphingomonas aerophila]MBB5714506.1 hypothetical protein [Sphingomonas aerophila]
MIGLSVAIGRFVEALFWAIFRVAGSLAVAAVGGVLILLLSYVAIRWLLKRQ